jgi:hypothetical protein
VSWKVRRATLETASTARLLMALGDPNRFVRVEAVRRLIPRFSEEGVEAALIGRLEETGKNWLLPRSERQQLSEAAERIAWAIYPLRDLPIAASEPAPGSAKDLPIPWRRRYRV